jgi:hypothetical protein
MLTSRGTATGVLGGILVVGGWTLSLPELFAVGAALLAIVLLAILWVWSPVRRPKLTAVAHPNPAHAGSTLTVSTTLTARTFRPLLLMADLSDGRSVRLWAKPQRSTPLNGSFPLTVPHRGRLSVGPFAVVSVDALGLARRRIALGPTLDLRIRPMVFPAAPIPLAAGTSADRLRPIEAHRSRPGNGGTEPAGLRQYIEGDELRLVHWTASARGRGLLVRTFDDDTDVAPTVLLDDRSQVHTDESFELALVAAASLATSSRTGSGAAGGQSDIEPMLLLWSELVGHRTLPDHSLYGSAALDRLVDATPAQVTTRSIDPMPLVDVVITGPLSTRDTDLDLGYNVLRLTVAPEGVTPRSARPTLMHPDELSQWTEFAQ